MPQRTADTDVIDRLVDACNRGDARGFAALFAEDGWHGDYLSAAPMIGREAIESRYAEAFAKYPENRTEVAHRIAFGPFVIDHERARRAGARMSADAMNPGCRHVREPVCERIEARHVAVRHG